jgi:hypothetical protein
MPSVRFKRFCQLRTNFADHIVCLMKFESEQLDAPLYLSSVEFNISSRGNIYTGAQLDYKLPGQVDGQIENGAVIMPGISPQLIKLMEDHPGRFLIRMELVLKDTPDVVESGPFNMRSDRFNVDYDSQTGMLETIFTDTMDLPLVTKRFSVGLVPGAYGAGES